MPHIAPEYVPYPALSYPTLPYPTLSYPILPCPTLSNPIQPFPTLSYPILPCRTLSYPIQPYPTLSYPILPYPTLSYPIPRICTPQIWEPPRRGGALLGRGFSRLYRGGFGGNRKPPYKQNGGRVKGGRQAANSTHLRRIGTPRPREPPIRGGALLGRGPPIFISGGSAGAANLPTSKTGDRV